MRCCARSQHAASGGGRPTACKCADRSTRHACSRHGSRGLLLQHPAAQPTAGTSLQPRALGRCDPLCSWTFDCASCSSSAAAAGGGGSAAAVAAATTPAAALPLNCCFAGCSPHPAGAAAPVTPATRQPAPIHAAAPPAACAGRMRGGSGAHACQPRRRQRHPAAASRQAEQRVLPGQGGAERGRGSGLRAHQPGATARGSNTQMFCLRGLAELPSATWRPPAMRSQTVPCIFSVTGG